MTSFWHQHEVGEQHVKRSISHEANRPLPFKSLQVYVAFERRRGGGTLILLAGHVDAFCSQELSIGPGCVK